jgi:phospholipid/cholesterol/gamma-HCH transport system substrate-binding protein
MPRESNLEFKVGLFVLIALVGLIMFIFSVNDSTVLEKGKSVRVVFGFANGLKKNAPVRFAGVDEGIVKEITLFFDQAEQKTKVALDLWIKKDTKIPSDSAVVVNQLGMMGEKYIEIFPGKDTQNFFKEGQTVLGKDPVAQSALSDRMMEVSDQLESAVAGVNRLISDEKNIESIRTTLENFSLLTGSLDDIIYSISEGRGTVGKLLYDERLYDDLEGLAADLKANPWKLLYRPKKSK